MFNEDQLEPGYIDDLEEFIYEFAGELNTLNLVFMGAEDSAISHEDITALYFFTRTLKDRFDLLSMALGYGANCYKRNAEKFKEGIYGTVKVNGLKEIKEIREKAGATT